MFSPEQARRFYNLFGKKQDSQGFYENPALDRLIQFSDFDKAEEIWEVKYNQTVVSWGIPSEILVARCLK
jgi:hypothetical protein